MADDDKTASPSTPTKPADGGSKAGPIGGTGPIKPASGTSPSATPVGAGAKSTDKPSFDKPSSAKVSSGPAAPAAKPGSEWTASDDRGPLGRAEDEIDETETKASRDQAAKSSGGPAGIAATPVSPKSDPTGKDAVTKGSDAKTSYVKTSDVKASNPKATTAADVKSSNTSKTAGVPPVDAPSTAARTSVASASPKPAGNPEKAKRSLWPVAAALIIGAVIGAGSAAFVYRGYADDGQPDPKVADLTTRVDALEKRPDPQAAIGKLTTSVTALDTKVAGLRQGGPRQDGSRQDKAASSAQPQAAATQPNSELDEINKKVAALQAKVDEPKPNNDKALEDKVGALQSELDKAKSEAAAAQATIAAVQGQQKEIAGRVMVPAVAVVADSLVQQIDHGQPYATQVDALAALGADPAKVAVLRENAAKGVPSARQLEAKFEPLVQPITATATKAPANAGLGERLKSGMFSIVSIRRADDTSGDDLSSRVARIKAALDHDDVSTAFDTWSKLPPDAKAKADAWGALVKTHVEAMDAARALQQDAIVALGSKKS